MKKLTLSKETVRNLDNENLDLVKGGNWAENTTIGRKCARLTTCTLAICC